MRRRNKRLLLQLCLSLCWLAVYWLISVLWLNLFHLTSEPPSIPRFKRIPGLLPDFQCPSNQALFSANTTSLPREFGLRSPPINAAKRVLILVDEQQHSAEQQKSLLTFLQYFKVPIRVQTHYSGQTLLLELDAQQARFSLIVIADYRIFHRLSAHEKQFLREHIHRHNIGIISFYQFDATGKFSEFRTFNRKRIERILFPAESPVRNIAKENAEYLLEGSELAIEWTVFKANSQNGSVLRPILTARDVRGDDYLVAMQLEQRHLLFGALPHIHWSVKIALLDSVAHFAPNIWEEDLDRFVQIDIDDMFVGASGTRFLVDDVLALLTAQSELRQHIHNFGFTIGFSGYYFRRGDAEEVHGDEALVVHAEAFHWFPHMWRHNHAHEHSPDYLLALMTQNRLFANNTGLPVQLQYAVSPQHAGVYPLYEPIYVGWKQIWGVQVTSTEEYPHLRPAAKRRGFVHANISVLPRQTCGLFTHTHFLHAYPEGIGHFRDNIFGGELFSAVLLNPFSIFMTHQQNFANDRMGAYTFLNAARFIKCWTNIHLKWTNPVELAQMYFRRFPEEKTLLHTNVCADLRHRRILSANQTAECSTRRLPNLLIVGPQKTGTSALSLFLTLHTNLVATNAPIAHSHEELQFFAGPNYEQGANWYASQFALVSKTAQIVFEKTANYFDNPRAPEAAAALLPDAKIVVLADDPTQRAYSWYQHMRAHNETAALKYTAEEVLMGNFSDAQQLKRRCLWPGIYARHLDSWLDHFAPAQLIMVDGHRLRTEPHFVLEELFAQLELPPLGGLARRLRFSREKGFYCAVTDAAGKETLRCLGQGKGRRYKQMSNTLRQHLDTYYEQSNAAFKQLLKKHGYQIPTFLQTD